MIYMGTCRKCGKEIKFITDQNGKKLTLHLDGCCHEYNYHYGKYDSFVNPSASCNICGSKVFFYQSPHGGQVYFDELGPPWPKHNCTEKPRIINSFTKFQWKEKNLRPFKLLDVKNGSAGITGVFLDEGKFNKKPIKRHFIVGKSIVETILKKWDYHPILVKHSENEKNILFEFYTFFKHPTKKSKISQFIFHAKQKQKKSHVQSQKRQRT